MRRKRSQDHEASEPDVLLDAEGQPVENPTVSGILPPIPAQGGVPDWSGDDPGPAHPQAIHPPFPEEAVHPAEPVAAEPEPAPPAFSEPMPEPEPVAEAEPVPEPMSEPGPEPEPFPTPEPVAERFPEPERGWEPAAEPEPGPAPEVALEPQPVPEPDLAPEPDLVAEAAAAEPGPEPGWEPVAESEPVSEVETPAPTLDSGPAAAPEVSIPQPPQATHEPNPEPAAAGSAGPLPALRAAASDWAAKSSSRPELLVGAACAGGVALALLIRRVGSR